MARRGDSGVVVIGNAPTALTETVRLIREENWRPHLVIGVPVGFVSAAESKQALADGESLPVPYITCIGRKRRQPLRRLHRERPPAAGRRRQPDQRISMALGKFFGVGIGPGDPELLTVKATKVLGSVPVVFVPKAKITDEGMALQILLNSVVDRQHSKLHELIFPMSKDPEIPQAGPWKRPGKRC